MTQLLTCVRRTLPLRLLSSVTVALGCLLGVGVFLVPALGVATAGPWLPLAVLAALLAAWCTVSSSAVLASARGRAGDSGSRQHGTHIDLRDHLGVWPARLSSVAFLAGQVILAAGIAGVLTDHLWPGGRSWSGPLVIAVATTLVIARLPRPRGLGLLPVLVVGVLAIVVAAAVALEPAPSGAPVPVVEISGVAEAAAMAFVAFCGFERFTTRGARPRSGVIAPMTIALLASAALILIVAFAGWHQLGPHRLGLSPTPLLDLVVAADAAPLATLVGIAALAAMLPPVIAALTSARDAMRVSIVEGDVRWPSRARSDASEPSWSVELVVGLAACVAVLVLAPAAVLAMGVCLLLTHYAFLNASARLIAGEQDTASARRGCTGMFASVILAMSLPVAALAGTALVLAFGAAALALTARPWR
ncbi:MULTISPECIES: hypothetical protein [Actinoalloteichus]|uniref:Uncharacterized protein n=1 Tax=Actinoalloteichus fjordicus TaxID=1612552 RepID=A0AAC9LIM8_9PSEU|nr:MULTISPECIES: hypothetical protein [Actinoalloteichus]APU17024.1 hypothetical protein UA74_25050 [Actinoalloteichus fjordicus]APU23104.1 hypothetical protein UA75_25630 [Actinoalloteichus sp. GBA129-24]